MVIKSKHLHTSSHSHTNILTMSHIYTKTHITTPDPKTIHTCYEIPSHIYTQYILMIQAFVNLSLTYQNPHYIDQSTIEHHT